MYPNLGQELRLMQLNGRGLTAIVYASISLLSVLSTILFIINLKGWVRQLGYVTLATFSFFCIASVLLTNEGISVSSWSSALNNIDSKTLISFFLNFASPLIICLGLTIIYVLLHQIAENVIDKIKRSWITGLLFIASLALSHYTLNYSNGIKDGFHPIQKILITYEFYKQYPIYSGDRDSLHITSDDYLLSVDTSHIWLIVDESVRYDAFAKTWTSIAEGIVSPHSFIVQREIVSGAVCSDYANALLVVGMGPEQLPDIEYQALRKPTIFAYAKSSGYNTAWVNTYGEDNGPYGFINESAIEDIDTIITLKDSDAKPEPYEYDLILLKLGLEWAESHPRTFVYINKIGCHFPYDRYSKPEQKTQNSYLDCVDYTMKSYFSEFYLKERKNDVLFYTSDHGQHLGENPAISLTHCARAEVHQSMASVPYLVILDSNQIDYVPRSNRPPTHQTLFYDVLEQLNSKYTSLYPDSLAKNKVEYSSGDIFGRSELYKHPFIFESK